MRQTAAIFVDAYRELNAKRLFWIVLILSGLVVVAYAAIGINKKGLTVLVWEIPSVLNTSLVSADLFYKWVYANLGIKFWLGWIATILALVSTAGMIPDFASSGSIELTLCKPIGRLRLFLTKYVAGLLFVTLQVGVFSAACFVVIGIRGKSWEPGLFWAVPLTVCLFSYLYSICALIGLLTRSTVAALLLTLLIWFGIFGVHATESSLLMFRERSQLRVEKMEARVQTARNAIDRSTAAVEEATASAPPPESDSPPADGGGEPESKAVRDARKKLAEAQKKLGDDQTKLGSESKKLADEQGDHASIARWHRIVFAVKTVGPKTSETTDLLRRTLISAADLARLQENDNESPDPMPDRDIRINGAELGRRIEAELRRRPVSWVLGTSLGFEALMLAVAAWVFCRRDF